MGNEAVSLAEVTDGADTKLTSDHKRPVDDLESEPFPRKKVAKETSNDDILSEVSNPVLSPTEKDSSIQTISSQVVELAGGNQVGLGEITSTGSLNSSTESSSDEERSRNDSSSAASVTHVVLEAPNPATSSGIRKITFKFNNRRVEPATNGDISDVGPTDFDDVGPVINERTNWNRVHEARNSSSCLPNLELELSRRVVTESYPTNVKKLLATGILEGAPVKYVSPTGEKQLDGIITSSGYMCGCPLCNFQSTQVLSAYEFEMHAGGRTRHPNNHIYLENGRAIYSCIQELKGTPLGLLEEVVKRMAGSSVNERSFQRWKASIVQNSEIDKTDKYYHARRPHLVTSYYSHSVEDSIRPTSCSFVQNFSPKQRKTMKETFEDIKNVKKKPHSWFSAPIVRQKKTSEGSTKKRDNDLHRLLFMPNGLPDGAELAYYSKGQRVRDGYKQGNGIVCCCCNVEMSPSQFEAHAGWGTRRQPYRHIYTSNGLTLHDIAISLANGQSLTTSGSDDMCTVCGDGGDLILCGGCPRAFHRACLEPHCLPEGDRRCLYCTDKFGPGESSTLTRPIMIRLTRVVKAPEYEPGGCVVCRANDFSVANFDERTIMLCDQCEKEFHVGCLRDSGLCDLKELPPDKWFCNEDCERIHLALQNLVVGGEEPIPTSALSTINRKRAEKGIFYGVPNDLQWRVLSGKGRCAEHLPFLSSAAAIFRECFDPIVAASGRDLIPVMVYGRNISGQEFGGLYCIVLVVGSVVVSAGLLRIFGRDVAELPLVATTRENQGKGYFQALLACVERLLSSLGVQNLVLPAAEEAESIWTRKFGFRNMSEERLKKYKRNFQLTIFKGTSMLEKEVQQIRDE